MAGLYVHVPFCQQRCVYCDFYFVTTRRDTPAYARALVTEIEAYGREYGAREPVETVYFGGGTPSMLALEDWAAVVAALRRHFDLGAVEEFTVEANPEDVTADYLRALRDLGVTRLSLGVQSFADDELRFMGRAHDAAQAEAAARAVAGAGFASWTLDLIFGVPGQPLGRWLDHVERAVALGAPHLSTYGLTVEERTPLAKQVERGLVEPAAEEDQRLAYLATMDALGRHGFAHYEVSSFARPGHRSRHNGLYWRGGNYLGFGPSAHSFWKRTRSMGVRWANVRHLGRWAELLRQGQRPLDWEEQLGQDELADEYLLTRLRLLDDGLDLETFARDFGVDLLAERADELAELERAGLARVAGGALRLTREGALVADAVTARLLGP